MTNNILIEAKDLKRVYHVGKEDVFALNGISFTINHGEVTVILGPSGSGKSTLLNILGGMDKPSSGRVSIDEKRIDTYGDRDLNTYRRTDIGFVFQFYNLMPNLTAKENVEVSAKISKHPLSVAKALSLVGLEKRGNHFPDELSGGEQQRVAIARAICKNPKILLCDEPTGALDSETGKAILETLWAMCKDNGQTVVIVTHNAAIAKAAQRVIHLKDGRILKNERIDNPLSLDEVEW